MKILCICPIGIGNYLLMYPACVLLKRVRPEARLHLLALREAIVEIGRDDALWSRTRCLDPATRPSVARQLRFFRELSMERYDASLSFFPSNNWQYNLLPFLCGVAVRWAFEYPLKQGTSLSFLNSRQMPLDLEAHDVNQNIRLVAAFSGQSLTGEPVTFPSLFTASDHAAALEYIGTLGRPRRCIAVHPGSSGEHGMAAKRWDPMRFGELAGKIGAALDARVLVFGGRGEEKIKQVTASMIKPSCHIVEPRGLRATAALLSECSMLLCNDSGLMHIAACMGVPVAAVFGPTDEKRNGPYGKGHLVVRKPMDGFPVWNAATAGVRELRSGVDPSASLKALSVDAAWEQLRPWLEKLHVQSLP
ncbi:MAG: glycosyltransferase family 9 protein [Chitinispirillaceae bacterium]|nr:glycosyltransferase family 9 protein [Chitinispirillaceae bacterium]